MTDLKRKKSSQDSERHSKRAAIQPTSQASTVKFSVVPDQEGAEPVVVSAPGFAVPTSIPFKAYKKSRARASKLPRGSQASGISTSELLLHSSAHPSIDYIAREEEAESSEGLLRHYVGVYDPETGEVQVMAARKMVLRGAVRAVDGESESEDGRDAPRSALARRQELGETFGSKKTQKAIASLRENAIMRGEHASPSQGRGASAASDALKTALLESMDAAVAGTATREQMQTASDEAKPRPKANVAATAVEDVYTLDELIGPDTMQVLVVQDWLDAAAADQAVAVRSRYVGRRLENMARRAASAAAGELAREAAMTKLKVLRYIMLLLDLFAAARSGGGKDRMSKRLPPRDELRQALGVQDFLIEGVRKKFSDGAFMSKWHVDKLFTYLAAMTLIVDDYETDTYDLGEDLRLDPRGISQYYKELGCKLAPPNHAQREKYKISSSAEASQHKIATLNLPLVFPKTSVGRAGGGAAKKRR